MGQPCEFQVEVLGMATADDWAENLLPAAAGARALEAENAALRAMLAEFRAELAAKEFLLGGMRAD